MRNRTLTQNLAAVFLTLCGAVAAAAQSDRVEVIGVVMNSQTGKPVASARVTLRVTTGQGGQAANGFLTLPLQQGPAGGSQGTTLGPVMTNGDGQFTFRDVNQGYFQVAVEATGYLGSQSTENPLANERQINMTVRLKPLGSVSGRIVDEAGRPAARVDVELFRHAYDSLGYESREVIDKAQTDDRGEFRIYWVPDGWYYLSAYAGYANNKLSATTSPTERTTFYRTTYYPNSFDPAAASGIRVRPGEDVRLQEFVSRPEEYHRIRGRVIDGSTGQELSLARRFAEAGIASRQVRGSGFSSNGNARPDETFEIPQVAKGFYWLRVKVFETDQSSRVPGAPQLTGMMPVDVGDSDVNDLVVTVYPAATVSGRITLDGPDAQSKIVLEGMMVSLLPVTLYPSMVPRNLTGTVRENGTFTIENVAAGEYSATFGGSPLVSRSSRAVYASEARFNQTNLLESPVVVAGNSSGEIRITLTAQPARLDGKILNGDLRLEAVLIPKDLSRRELYQSAFVNPDGSFSMPTVIPGDYTLYFWEQRPSREYLDPNFIRRFANSGTPVHLSPSEPVHVESNTISRMDP